MPPMLAEASRVFRFRLPDSQRVAEIMQSMAWAILAVCHACSFLNAAIVARPRSIDDPPIEFVEQ